jgi:aldose 1-epimerase
MLTLEASTYRASLAPELGGLVTEAKAYVSGTWVDILRADPGPNGWMDGLPLFGCFPMVPFANRLSQPWIPAGKEQRPMPVNWPSEGLAMHGVGHATPWSLIETRPDLARIGTQIRDLDGRRLGRAEQRLELDEHGIHIDLSFRNTSGTLLSAGVGLHPWFAAPARHNGTKVAFNAKGIFELSADNLPAGHRDLSPAEVDIGWDDAGLDTCFTGWTGQAEIHRPEDQVAVSLRATSALLHCFVAPDFDAICLEPVTHAPNAAHDTRCAEIAPMHELAQGASIAVGMQIAASPLPHY